jgi:hypothetical protein
MSQLFRELDFGIAGEPGCEFDAGIAVAELNLEHGRHPTVWSSLHREMSVRWRA